MGVHNLKRIDINIYIYFFRGRGSQKLFNFHIIKFTEKFVYPTIIPSEGFPIGRMAAEAIRLAAQAKCFYSV